MFEVQRRESRTRSPRPSLAPRYCPGAPAARFEPTPAELRKGAPLLGEHSDEILI